MNTVAFILYRKGFYFLSLGHSSFASAYTSKPFQYRYFVAYPFGFKVFNQIGTRRYFQQVEKKNCFTWENQRNYLKAREQVHSSS